MVYTGLELFMESLKQLIYSNNNPLINNPSILTQRPQIQLLYEELGSMIQALFVEEEHDLNVVKKVKNLKKRFKDAAEEAQDIINLFVSGVNFRNKEHFIRSDVFKSSQSLEHVMRSIRSIKIEFTILINNIKMDSSHRTKRPKKQSAAGTSCTRNRLRMKYVLEEIVVGLDNDAMVIVEKLAEDQKQQDVVSIVGMGGLGKTTLATKVFNHGFVVYHFDVRAWITVSQAYKKRDLLIKILASITVQVDPKIVSDCKLHEMLHKSLKRKRYLIVLDDIWSIEAWDDLKLFFPNDNTGSRILLTSRLTKVVTHAKSHGFVHYLQYLTKEESWELLRKKVFHGDECPGWLIEPEMQIARNCHGLPLAVVVIAGVLTKEEMSKDSWDSIARSVSAYIVSDQNGYVETLALSYDHLPCHLRDCFLYLGGFPEDFKFPLPRLIQLWMAEGFIQEVGNQSLEETAEDYLMELIDRNLVIVADRKFNIGIKACSLHDLLREMCLEKATEEGFCLKIHRPMYSYPFEVITPDKQRRIFTNKDIHIVRFSHPPTPSIRSLLCFHKDTSLIYDIAEYFRSVALLRVLDLQKCKLIDFPQGIALLVHLRYLAIWHLLGFPSSICNLRSLQTLILKTSYVSLVLPNNISNLVNMRHLWSDKDLYLPSIKKPMNLQTISNVVLGEGVENFLKCFPGIEELDSTLYSDEENDFGLLPYLETLKLTDQGFRRSRKSVQLEVPRCQPNFQKNHITFPATLKNLTLVRCSLPWSNMSIIQSLPNLEVLKLLDNAFEGPLWNTGEEQFRQLKFLKLHKLNIQQWEASIINFPCLKRLVLDFCINLEEIPLEIGDISTLELIEAHLVSLSAGQSIDRIQEEQHAVGNDELKIICHLYDDFNVEAEIDDEKIRQIQ